VDDMRPLIRRTRRTQQALVGLSVVGALGAATTLELTTQTASAGAGARSTSTRIHARTGSTVSGGRVAGDPNPRTGSPAKRQATTPTKTQPTPSRQAQPQPVAPPAGGSTQATTSGS